jgi:hypothetical protein
MKKFALLACLGIFLLGASQVVKAQEQPTGAPDTSVIKVEPKPAAPATVQKSVPSEQKTTTESQSGSNNTLYIVIGMIVLVLVVIGAMTILKKSKRQNK